MKIAAARRGRKWSARVKKKIGIGVRKGASNKVPFNLRLDPEVDKRFRAKVKARGHKINIAAEEAFEKW